jgi:type IV pilus assembly protein PilX
MTPLRARTLSPRLAGRPLGPKQRQRGVVLLIALIALVAMTLAGVALIRSMDTGTIAAGNIAFRQGSVQSADGGTEAARTWLLANVNSLDSDNSAKAYYATRQDAVDLTGNRSAVGSDDVDWDGTKGALLVKGLAVNAGAADVAGNRVYYIIQRMCTKALPKNDPSNDCANGESAGTGSTNEAAAYDVYGVGEDSAVYFRVTTKVVGPKDTVTYIQTLLLI